MTAHSMGRRSGILLHPTSLPGDFGIGDLGPTARSFLVWLEGAGQTVWQLLPLGPTGGGDSPYDAASVFAGNPLLISLEELVADRLLATDELAPYRLPSARTVDFAAVRGAREKLLRLAFARFLEGRSPELASAHAAFRDAPGQRSWLADWSLFCALKSEQGDAPWPTWPPPLRRREKRALAAARRRLAAEIDYHTYVQCLFFRQWERLRAAAAEHRVLLCGDLPLYVALDSADVWSRRQFFAVDEDGGQPAVAGVPPDAFSDDGQRWGNPLYRWDRLEGDGFAWWIERLAAALRQADRVRFDHFRGLAAYWSVPASSPTAIDGEWIEGPGERLLAALAERFPDLPLVAEDLGVITPEVEALRRRFALPGMKVLQFAFSAVDSSHLPHHHRPDSVVYTGTHDNDTSRSWLENLDPESRRRALDYLGGSADDGVRQLIRAALTSVADWSILPLQDLLELGGEARMNRPGTASGNWRFRLLPGEPGASEAERLRRLTELSGRLPEAQPTQPGAHVERDERTAC